MLDINENGSRFWFNEKGALHRVGGPAIEWMSGKKEWWLNNKIHRLDGPAIEGLTGSKEWWIEGIRYNEEEYWEKVGETC